MFDPNSLPMSPAGSYTSTSVLFCFAARNASTAQRMRSAGRVACRGAIAMPALNSMWTDASPARHRLGGQVLAHAGADGVEDRVARAVPEDAVDVGHVVDAEDREHQVAARGQVLQLGRQFGVEDPPVAQAAQRVGVRGELG